MALINCKVYLELNLIEDYILSSRGNSAKFKIVDAKLHVPIVTLSTKDSADLTKQLNEGFKRSAYWNSYEIRPAQVIRLFLLAYFIAAGNNAGQEACIKDNKNYFLPKWEIKNYNLLIDGRNFYDQPINDLLKQYGEVTKVSTDYGDYHTTGCLLDYAFIVIFNEKDKYEKMKENVRNENEKQEIMRLSSVNSKI